MMPDGIAGIAAQLLAAGIMGGLIGFERRVHHKAIGIAGMVMIAIGSTTYMLLATHLAQTDPSSISRTLQGFLSGIGFLGGAVIFKSGFDVKGKGCRRGMDNWRDRAGDRHILLAARDHGWDYNRADYV